MQKLSGKNLLLVSFTLFSMFFGAGNLIFPPHLGAQAGTSLWPAFAGLAVSAVGLPIAGVVAVARAGGLDKLAGRVHPVFAMVFTILVYLSIGPVPCHSPHGQHLVPDAGAADRRRYRAAAGLLGAVFCSGLSGGAAAGKAYRLAGPHPLPLPDRAHRGAVCRVSHPSAGGTLRHTQRRVRSPARCAGHPVRLPDHGHAGRAEFWRGHRPEHPRPGCHRKPCRGGRHHPGRFYCRRAAAGGLRHAGPRRGRDRHGVSGPCHRCRGAYRSGTDSCSAGRALCSLRPSLSLPASTPAWA